MTALRTKVSLQTRRSWRVSKLRHWDDELPRFWQVCPKEMVSRLPRPLSDRVEGVRA